MKVFSSIFFVLSRSWAATRVLLSLYIAIIIGLGFMNSLYILFYSLIIDAANSKKTIFGLSIISLVYIRLIYEIVNTLLDKLKEYVWNVLDTKLALYNNQDFIKKLSTLDLPTYENPEKNDLMWRTLNRFQFQFKYYLQYLVDVIQKSVQFGITIAIFLFGSPWAAIFVFVSNIIPIIVRSRFGKYSFLIYRADSDTRKKFESLQSMICGRDTLPEIKIFNSFEFFRVQLYTLYKQFTNKQLQLFKKIWIVTSFVEMLPVLSIFVFLLVTANQLMNKEITVGVFVLLYINVFWFSGNLSQLMSTIGSLLADSEFIQDAVGFYNLKSTITFPVLSSNSQIELTKNLDKPIICFDDVSFAYPASPDQLVLKKISFTLPYGQNLALIGENGAGKTTLVKLLLRMYDPTNGSIFINNIPIKELPEKTLFLLYSTLFQSFGKFNLTIRQILEMASVDKLTDEDYVHALKLSNAWEYIKTYPKTLDQQLGPHFKDGVDLSGGQWQQLAIAKAFLKKAPILILDEPTSAIDAKSEMEIFDRLIKEKKKNTLLFISHRFSTIKDAERIIVLDQGEIIEDGNHNELIMKKGKYHELYTIQAERYKR